MINFKGITVLLTSILGYCSRNATNNDFRVCIYTHIDGKERAIRHFTSTVWIDISSRNISRVGWIYVLLIVDVYFILKI